MHTWVITMLVLSPKITNWTHYLTTVEDRMVMNLFPWLPFLTGITITKETNCAETGEQLQGNKVVILNERVSIGKERTSLPRKLLQLCRK